MTTTPRPADVLAFFDRTSDQFFSKDEFKVKLKSGKKLRIKYGVDVTAPTLHIGHAVNLWLMRYLQDCGHKVIFVIGDFTTRIGDPDGRGETRPVIPREDIERNARHFIDQAKMVLRFDDPNLIEVRRNSEWLDKMALQDFMNLLAMVTHARLLSRDMFQKRIESHKDIHMHEIIYPILQGYDSVEIQADMTIIGSDQLFNEMMGRFFQERMGQKPQTIITTKITPGIDGKGKQSKSVGNYIGLGHSPRDKFGRVMSIPDDLIEQYFIVYTDLPMTEIAEMKSLIAAKPRDAKVKLAGAIVSRYHGKSVGAFETEWFEKTISRGQVPDDIPTLPIINPRMEALSLVALTRPGKSKSDTRRLLAQGGVELNGDKLQKPDEMLLLHTGDILKVGKRSWYRIEIMSMSVLETERLWIEPLELKDIDLIREYMPEWEIVKYLGKMPAPKMVAAAVATEVFKKVILQPEPKDEWLWKIKAKKEPEKIVGVAHLRRDVAEGNQNVWLTPEARGNGFAKEATAAINNFAFTQAGFQQIVFKEAFAHAAPPRDVEALRAQFAKLDANPAAGAKESWSVTREAWQKMQALPVTPLVLPGQPAIPGAPLLPGQVPVQAQVPGAPLLPGQIPAQPLLPGQLPGQLMMPGQVLGQPLLPGQIPGQPLLPGQLPGQPLLPGQLPGQVLMPGQVPGAPLMPGQIPGQPLPPGQVPGMPAQPAAPAPTPTIELHTLTGLPPVQPVIVPASLQPVPSAPIPAQPPAGQQPPTPKPKGKT